MAEHPYESSMPQGPYQGKDIIGESTEALHKFLLDGWTESTPVPRIEESLSFVPKDREEVIYIYMYRVSQNTSLMNSKRLRMTKFSVRDIENDTVGDQLYFERAPIYLEVQYVICVHSRFRSDAERLLGWVLLRLHEATHLVYRPRRYVLPTGQALDSTGKPWDSDSIDDEVIMEKVSLSLTDDLTVGDAINFFTINEAPFRPFLTYRARCSMEGPLLSGPPTPVEIIPPSLDSAPRSPEGDRKGVGRNGRMSTKRTKS